MFARVTRNIRHGLWLCPSCLARRTGIEILETHRREFLGPWRKYVWGASLEAQAPAGHGGGKLIEV